MGIVGAGIFLNRYLHAENLLKLPGNTGFRGSNMVAVTQGDNYESAFIRNRVEHLFNSLGGIGDVVQPGDKVGIKINLTGGSSWVGHENLEGVDFRECVWTHPEVLKAVGEGNNNTEASIARLYQNHPNPFRGFTKIIYYIENDGHVSLNVYDNSGQEVARLVNGMISGGEHSIEYTAYGLAAGTYYIKMETKGISLIKKMKLLR
jgi:hypothetical protein